MDNARREKSLRRSKMLFMLGVIFAVMGYVFAVANISPITQLSGLYLFIGGVTFTPMVAFKIVKLTMVEDSKK